MSALLYSRPCACALVVEKMQAAERGPVRKRVLLRFFALFCSCYVLGVVFLHYSASTANGRDEVATVTKLPAFVAMLLFFRRAQVWTR